MVLPQERSPRHRARACGQLSILAGNSPRQVGSEIRTSRGHARWQGNFRCSGDGIPREHNFRKGPRGPARPRGRQVCAGAGRSAAHARRGLEPAETSERGGRRRRDRGLGCSSAFRGVWLLSLPVSPDRHHRRLSRPGSSEPGCGRPSAPGRGAEPAAPVRRCR